MHGQNARRGDSQRKSWTLTKSNLIAQVRKPTPDRVKRVKEM